MSDYDDDEYESFDLDDAVRSRSSAPGQVAAVIGDDTDDLDDDTDAEDSDVEDADDEDDDEDELDDDEPEDAEEDEIDFVIAAYREDGQPQVLTLANDLANDLEELVTQLRRLPGEAGAIGFVSLVEEVFVIVRVRGRHVQVLLNDDGAANDWPIARDVAELLGEDVPDSDDDGEPLGDLGIFSDLGVSDFDMSSIAENLDLASDQMLIQIAEKINIGPQFRKLAESALGS